MRRKNLEIIGALFLNSTGWEPEPGTKLHDVWLQARAEISEKLNEAQYRLYSEARCPSFSPD